MNLKSVRISKTLFFISLILIIYMPLHVFIVQSASLVTGGLEIWKAAKDVLLVALIPLLLYLSYLRGLFQNKVFRRIMILGGTYTLIHGLYVLFDQNDDTYSAIVGSVYNTRLFGYLLLGYLVGSAKDGQKYLKYLLTAVVLIASLVALFGVLQYFLPSDLLTHVGYTIERGVKPLFFIDDKPDLPRVMSTLKDPNSLGAYLILPILLTGFAFVKNTVNKELFIKPFRKEVLGLMLGLMLLALFLTFSRGALIGLILSAATLLTIVKGNSVWVFMKKHWVLVAVSLIIIFLASFLLRNTYVFQNIVFHADEATVLEDPNELRVSLTQSAVEDVIETPQGHGPGSAGLVSINNPQGGVLTENYYLQIGYEVGWLGLVLFIAILVVIGYQLLRQSRKLRYTQDQTLSAVLLASLVGYLFYSLLIHLWSNEAISLQWWLLTGVFLGLSLKINSKSNL